MAAGLGSRGGEGGGIGTDWKGAQENFLGVMECSRYRWGIGYTGYSSVETH